MHLRAISFEMKCGPRHFFPQNSSPIEIKRLDTTVLEHIELFTKGPYKNFATFTKLNVNGKWLLTPSQRSFFTEFFIFWYSNLLLGIVKDSEHHTHHYVYATLLANELMWGKTTFDSFFAILEVCLKILIF